jgi:predicted SprT family Zn-dependent metalloprotease
MNPEWLTMGVGDGSGKLFVYGDYDSITAARKKLIDKENYLHALELIASGKVHDPKEYAVRALAGNEFTYCCIYCGKHYNSLDSFSRRDTQYACTECEWKGKPK